MINVKDNLPEVDIEVLTWSREFGYTVGYLKYSEGAEDHQQWWYVREKEYEGSLPVDYWQPLPDPPKEG